MCNKRRQSSVLGMALFACALGRVAAALDGPPPEAKPEDYIEEVVVTASRQEIRKGEETGTLTVVGRQEIQQQGADLIDEVLRSTPGLTVNRLGPLGEETHLFMRAGEADHVLVMIDGHQINIDGGGFDWKNMASHNIDRIEVLRGTGSALYGSDALVGVVNIITRRRKGPPELKMSIAGGTYDTIRESLSVTGGDETCDYSLSVVRFDMNDYEIDRRDCGRTSLWGSVGVQLGEETDMRLTFRTEDVDREHGSVGGTPAFWPPEPNAWNDRSSQLFGAVVTHAFSERWTAQARLTRFSQEELFANDPDSASDYTSRDNSVFERTVLDLQNEIVLGEGPNGRLDAVVGFEYDREGLRNNVDAVSVAWVIDDHNEYEGERASRSAYMQLREELGPLRLEANYRHENHDTLGSEDSFRVGAAGIAQKAPTMFETNGYSSTAWAGVTVGNPDLDPEGCEGYDIGVEQDLLDRRLALGTTWFTNRYTDYIVHISGVPNTFANAGRARSRGWEHFVVWKPLDNLTLRANYTHNHHRATHSDNSSTSFVEGDRLIRRPSDTVNLMVSYAPMPKVELFAEWNHVGSRDDVNFEAWPVTPRVMLKGYDRVDVTVSWKASEHLRVFGRWENIGDVHYEEAYGFEAPGQNLLAGLEWSVSF